MNLIAVLTLISAVTSTDVQGVNMRGISSVPVVTTSAPLISELSTFPSSITSSSRELPSSRISYSSVSLPSTSQPYLLQHLSAQTMTTLPSQFSVPGLGSYQSSSLMQQNQLNLLPQVTTAASSLYTNTESGSKLWNSVLPSTLYSTTQGTTVSSLLGTTAVSGPLYGTSQLLGTDPTLGITERSLIGTSERSLFGTSDTLPHGTADHLLYDPAAERSLLGTDNMLSHLDNTLIQEKIDTLEIPGKGRCNVYIARYSYNPFQQSPNENPEAELALNAGDYILVWGTIDEDGFFDGELLDGRRGLVPSNFIQKLENDDLLEFYKAIVLGVRNTDDSCSTNISQDFSSAMQNFDDSCMPIQTVNIYRKYPDLPDIFEEEDDEECENPANIVPPPGQLTLERQLNKSILIGWNHPTDAAPGSIDSYHVYVDGVLKTTVKSTERPRALVEGVDSNKPHRISVRAVTPNRRTSRDAACTMVIGKEVPLGPTSIKVSSLRSTSAVISWLPGNSNYQHVVCVNNVEVRTVKPGIYRHTITGLSPNTVYHVTIRAKNIRSPHFYAQTSQEAENLSCHIDFRTLPKDLPDPPAEVQVEPGPQDGTVLVTWLPVFSSSGTSVTGYTVFADGKKVTDVDSPTGDHVLIDINKLGMCPKQVTVRSKSKDSQSCDSQPSVIIPAILKGKPIKNPPDLMIDRRQHSDHYVTGPPPSRGMQQHPRGRQKPPSRMDNQGQMVIETEENLSDKEVYPSLPQYSDVHRGSPSKRRGYNMRGVPRNHVERGQPPLPPHSHHRTDHPPTQHRNMQDDRAYDYTNSGRSPRMSHRGNVAVDRGYRSGNTRTGRGTHRTQENYQRTTLTSVSPGKDKRVRYFEACFDYDPSTMSPNPEIRDEELSLTEGDIITVYGEKNSDGFYWGECLGRRGYVHQNMIYETSSPTSVSGGMKTSSRGIAESGYYRSSRDHWGDMYSNQPVRKMKALYDYDPKTQSPNLDSQQVELSFKTGDDIYIYGDMDSDGFFLGELNGERGLVPSNFLVEADKVSSQERISTIVYPDQSLGVRGPTPPPRDSRVGEIDRRKGIADARRRGIDRW